MSGTEPEDRLLNASELAMVAATKPPEIERQSKEDLKALLHRLRQAHSRANDIAARQQREIRGKAEPHGSRPVKENAGSAAKAQALFEAIQRLDSELSRREETKTDSPSQADFARHALELKMSREAAHHPDPGRPSSDGMRPKKRVEEFAGGTTRKEVGRVSQATKVAQARKDFRQVLTRRPRAERLSRTDSDYSRRVRPARRPALPRRPARPARRAATAGTRRVRRRGR